MVMVMVYGPKSADQVRGIESWIERGRRLVFEKLNRKVK